MLQHLELADGCAELLAFLDILIRDVVCRTHRPDGLRT